MMRQTRAKQSTGLYRWLLRHVFVSAVCAFTAMCPGCGTRATELSSGQSDDRPVGEGHVPGGGTAKDQQWAAFIPVEVNKKLDFVDVPEMMKDQEFVAALAYLLVSYGHEFIYDGSRVLVRPDFHEIIPGDRIYAHDREHEFRDYCWNLTSKAVGIQHHMARESDSGKQ